MIIKDADENSIFVSVDRFDALPMGDFERDPGFTLLKETVLHESFGKGEICKWSSGCNYIVVDFNGHERAFAYPDAFERWLMLEREDYQATIYEYLRKTKEARKRRNERKSPMRSLKYDKIEDTWFFVGIEAELERLIEDEIGKNGYLGFCHIYWMTKRRILRDKFGIEWRSPAELNPDVYFD